MLDLENLNPLSVEITKLLINDKLSTAKYNVKTSTAIFISTYSKVSSEIEYFKKNPNEVTKIINNEFKND